MLCLAYLLMNVGHKIVSYKHIRFLFWKKSEQKCETIIILNIKYEILMKDYYDTFIDQNIKKIQTLSLNPSPTARIKDWSK